MDYFSDRHTDVDDGHNWNMPHLVGAISWSYSSEFAISDNMQKRV
jgi:hypothetical protein